MLSTLQATHLSISPRQGGLGLPVGAQMYRCLLGGVSSHTQPFPLTYDILFLCIPCSCNTLQLHALYKIPSIRTEKFYMFRIREGLGSYAERDVVSILHAS